MGEVCVRGMCVANPCGGVTCAAGEVCDGGRCIEARKGLSGLGGALERAPTLN